MGWADSTSFARGITTSRGGNGHGHTVDGTKGGEWNADRQSLWHSGVSPAAAAIAATGAMAPSSSVGNSGSGGDGDASSTYRQNKARSNAAMGSTAFTYGSGGVAGDLDTGVRATRGGTAWTVPGDRPGGGDGDDGGSAAVWPASSAGAAMNDSGGSVAAAAAAMARSRSAGAAWGRGGTGSRRSGLGGGGGGEDWRRGGSPSPPRSAIPPPAVRPLDGGVRSPLPFSCSDAHVDMLAEMGFGRAHAAEALRVCDGNVERAAEWLLTADDDIPGVGAAIGEATPYGPHLPGVGDRVEDTGWSGGTELEAMGTKDDTGGKRSGDVDDDLVTNADAADVGQGLDLGDFWVPDTAYRGVASVPAMTDGFGGGEGGGGGESEWKRGVSFGEQGNSKTRGPEKVEDDDEDRDLVTR